MSYRLLNSTCLDCVLHSTLEKIPEDFPEEQKVELMQKIFQVFAEADDDCSGPVLTFYLAPILKEYLGIEDDFTEIKSKYNQMLLAHETQIWDLIQSHEDSLHTAIQYAQTGNYIDFGASSGVNDEKLNELLANSLSNEVDPLEYANLKKDLETSKTLLYLTDNCGEIVFDKLLLKQIHNQYPHLEITVMVRGKDVLNDSTMVDAKEVGLDQLFPVVTNGSGVAGTFLRDISEEAKERLYSADLIISKGMGNYETLRGCGLNIYFLFLCKCELFMKMYHKPRFTSILANDLRAPV